MGQSSANIGGGKIDVLEQMLGQTVNGGQCYGGLLIMLKDGLSIFNEYRAYVCQ